MAKPTKTTPTSDTEPENTAAPVEDMVPIAFRGVTFLVPKSGDDWDTDAWIAVLRSQYYQVAQFQLSATKQWAVLKQLAPTRGDMNEFLKVFGDALREGVDFS